MRDIVIVPVYWRSNYILHALECLRACEGIENKDVRIYQDDRFDLPQNKRAEWLFTREISQLWVSYRNLDWKFRQLPPHEFTRVADDSKPHPVSFLTFHALREAYESDAQYVYLVYDDVWVTPDFFRWSEAVHQNGNYFHTVAEREFRQFQPGPKPKDPSAYYRAGTNLMDGGACWKRKDLGTLLRYPSNTVVDHRFPPIPFKDRCPMVPSAQRAFHVGSRSSSTPDDGYYVCGDIDPVTVEMPIYEWNKVYEEKQ